MAHGGGKDVILTLIIRLVSVGDLLESTKRLGDVEGDTGLFCYDKGF
jgi:hypothetical protein